jgi:hypothetical protein
MESFDLPAFIDGTGLAISITLMTRFITWIIFMPSKEEAIAYLVYYFLSAGLFSDLMIICSFFHILKPSEIILTF